MVRRIEAPAVDAPRAQADQLLDVFSPMPRPPVLDLGIEFATALAPQAVPAYESMAAAAETAERVEPGAEALADGAAGADMAEAVATLGPGPRDGQGLAGELRLQRAAPEPPARRPQAARGIEPLASALEAAVRLAADASVAAEALENLKRLLQHKQQLEGFRSTQGLLAQPPQQGVEEPTAALAPPPLPLLPLPGPAAEAAMGHARLPLVPRRRASVERRGLDVRGFMAGFALSWAFGVVLYFLMTAG
jgi:hypothetical protein